MSGADCLLLDTIRRTEDLDGHRVWIMTCRCGGVHAIYPYHDDDEALRDPAPRLRAADRALLRGHAAARRAVTGEAG